MRILILLSLVAIFSACGKPQEQSKQDKAEEKARNIESLKVTIAQNGCIKKREKEASYWDCSGLNGEDKEKVAAQIERFNTLVASYIDLYGQTYEEEEIKKIYEIEGRLTSKLEVIYKDERDRSKCK